ncbi:MAG: glycosyltransferase family protein [Propionibacteriaceae bacterium]
MVKRLGMYVRRSIVTEAINGDRGCIKYVGYYDTPENERESRRYVMSAASKMDYISSLIKRIGFDVLIVSRSSTTGRRFFPGKRIQLDEQLALMLFPTLPWGGLIKKAISLVFANLTMFFYLVLKTTPGEPVIVYHSPGLMRVVRYAKKVRNFKLILEVEEIYQDVQPLGRSGERAERAVLGMADGFIFSTELLEDSVNPEHKPSIVIYGNYDIQPESGLAFSDGKRHAVYAGTFDPIKGGAAIAVAAARFLDGGYHIHIIGFGSVHDTVQLQREIGEVSKVSKCTVTLDGQLSGREYVTFLQKCDIGLSTQQPTGKFNQSSFPSKIVSYLANGLHVVSVPLLAVDNCGLARCIVFSEGSEPKAIAEAVRSIDTSELPMGREVLTGLDAQLLEDVTALLSLVQG